MSARRIGLALVVAIATWGCGSKTDGSPANADAGVRKAGVAVLKGGFQGGLAEATARLLGHRPGGCPACADPHLTAGSRLLLTLLSPPEQRSLPAKSRWAATAVVRLLLHLWNPLAPAAEGPSNRERCGEANGRSGRGT